MIEDISYGEYISLYDQYFNEFRDLRQTIIYAVVGQTIETRLYASLFIRLNNEDEIEFSHNPAMSHHP